MGPDSGPPGGGRSKLGLFLGLGGGALAVVLIAVAAVVLLRPDDASVRPTAGGSSPTSNANATPPSTTAATPSTPVSPAAGGQNTSDRTLVAAGTAGGLQRDRKYEKQLDKKRKKFQQKYGNQLPFDLDKLRQQQKQKAKASGVDFGGSVTAIYRGKGKDPLTGEPRRVRFFGYYGEIGNPSRIINGMMQNFPDKQGFQVKQVDPGDLGGQAACSSFSMSVPSMTGDKKSMKLQSTSCIWVDHSTFGMITADRGLADTADLMRKMRPDLTK